MAFWVKFVSDTSVLDFLSRSNTTLSVQLFSSTVTLLLFILVGRVRDVMLRLLSLLIKMGFLKSSSADKIVGAPGL